MMLDCGCQHQHPKCDECRAFRRLLYELAGRWARRCQLADDPAARAARLQEYERRAKAGVPIFEEAAA